MRKKRWIKVTASPLNADGKAVCKRRSVSKKKQSSWLEVQPNSDPTVGSVPPDDRIFYRQTPEYRYCYPKDNLGELRSTFNSFTRITERSPIRVNSGNSSRSISSPALVRQKVSMMHEPTLVEGDKEVVNSHDQVEEITPTERAEENFMDQFYEHFNSALERTLTKCYAWPPTEDIIESCGFLDDDDGYSSEQKSNDDNSNVNTTAHKGQGESEKAARDDRNGGEMLSTSCSLKISNIDGETAVDDIRFEFPRACCITIKNLKSAGQLPEAIAQFSTPEEADAAYERSQLKKLGYRSLDWIRMNELVLGNMPSEVTKEAIKKLFPHVKKLKRRYFSGQVVLQFKTPEKAAEAFCTTDLLPAGERCLSWKTCRMESSPKESYADDYCSDPERTILISDVEDDSEIEVRKMFPRAKSLQLRRSSRGRRKVALTYDSAAEAEKDYKQTGLRKLDWVFPDEVKVENVPAYATESDFKIRLPGYTNLKRREDGRTVILKFGNRQEAEQAAKDSGLIQLGNRGLRWTWTEPCESNDVEEAESDKTDSWESKQQDSAETGSKKEAAISNISNLFTKTIYVTNLPTWFSISKLRNIYPKAIKIQVMNWKKRKLAIVEFESTILAAKACYATKRIRINGKKLKASPRKPAGFKRLQKSTMEQDEAKNVLGKVSLKDI